MEWTDIGQLGLTGLSLVGGFVAWWQAHLSADARRNAEAARKNAEDQARATVQIADSLRRPDLEFVFVRWDTRVGCDLVTQFVNRTGVPVHVEEIHQDQARGFVTTTFRKGWSVDLADPVTFIALAGGGIPSEVELTVNGEIRKFYVPHGPAS